MVLYAAAAKASCFLLKFVPFKYRNLLKTWFANVPHVKTSLFIANEVLRTEENNISQKCSVSGIWFTYLNVKVAPNNDLHFKIVNLKKEFYKPESSILKSKQKEILVCTLTNLYITIKIIIHKLHSYFELKLFEFALTML